MRRREFIATLGGAAAWPMVTRSQKCEMWHFDSCNTAKRRHVSRMITNRPFVLDLENKTLDRGPFRGRNLFKRSPKAILNADARTVSVDLDRSLCNS
jgi:hypothetical protein